MRYRAVRLDTWKAVRTERSNSQQKLGITGDIWKPVPSFASALRIEFNDVARVALLLVVSAVRSRKWELSANTGTPRENIVSATCPVLSPRESTLFVVTLAIRFAT